MKMPQGFIDMVITDIKRIDKIGNMTTVELLRLHRELDGKYPAIVSVALLKK